MEILGPLNIHAGTSKKNINQKTLHYNHRKQFNTGIRNNKTKQDSKEIEGSLSSGEISNLNFQN